MINLRDGEAVRYARRNGLYVPVCRPTKWGNPFTIGRDGDRQQVVLKHRFWFEESDEAAPLREACHPELYGKWLGCYCAPAMCHADYLCEFAEWAEVMIRTLQGRR